MEYNAKISLLSIKFQEDYPANIYPELMLKPERPYTCLLIDTYSDYFICIPFRSCILHNNAYIFKTTKRSKKSRSGLDYSKVILIKDCKYFSSDIAIVDQDEYREVMKNIFKIVGDIVKYINKYVRHVKSEELIKDKEFERRYKFSTLPYFHDVLGIEESL